MKLDKFVILLFIILITSPLLTFADERLMLATTTSTDNSGLLAKLHPPFEKQNNVTIDVIAVGTGKALRLAENGDVDLVLVHAPAAEINFINKGYGIEREPVMHNDFIIIGPADDQAGITRSGGLAEALKLLANSGQLFISRGDESGTHKKEKQLWKSAGIEPKGKWYLSAGQGMGAVLQIADDKQAYALSDRGTYLAYKDKINLKIVFEGDKELYNPYHVILVNPERHPHVNTTLARKYSAYIRGVAGQEIIRNFTIAGEQLFIPDVINE